MAVIEKRRILLALAGAALLATPAATASLPAFPAPEREVMVPVKGGRIFVRINGSAKAKAGKLPVIFLHGGPGGTLVSMLEALALADERMVILYDQLDSGRSDQPNDPANWKVARFVAELEAIRAALGIRRWHVVGHSWGGTVALEYAAKRPAALAGLVLSSPLVSTRRWIADTNALRNRLPSAIQADLTACEGKAPPPQARCAAAAAAFEASFYRREPDSPAKAAYRDPKDRGFNPTLYRTMWGSSEFVSSGTLKTYDGEALLARLNGSRTLFMVGQHDEVRLETAALHADRVPGAELAVVPGAGHATFIDRPGEAIGILRAWLNRQDARR